MGSLDAATAVTICRMPRTARAIVAGGCYHLINRGNQRATVFHKRADYAGFYEALCEACRRFPLELFAACLMPNHFHVVARSSDESAISRWMHWLLTTHTSRYRARYGSTGRIWQGRFKAFPIEQDSHLLTVMRYVERNALRAGLVTRARDWEWSSLAWRFGGDDDGPLARPPAPLPTNWADYVEAAQTADELAAIRQCVNRQRPYGSQPWIEQAATELGLGSSTRPRGRPTRSRAPDSDDCMAQPPRLAEGAGK